MKRSLGVCLLLCLFLCGCGMERMKEPVTFYYLKSNYEYFSCNGVIDREEREAAGHREDLSYLLALYLMGPTEEELRSPLPRGVWILAAAQEARQITIQLSDTLENMSDLDYSLACACLSMTCLDMTDAERVTIISGDRSVTMGWDTLTLYDGSETAPTEEAQ